jgi:hypothetical protein
MAIGYVALLSLVALIVILSFTAGGSRRPVVGAGGPFAVEEGRSCLDERIELQQSGRFIELLGRGGVESMLWCAADYSSSCAGGASAVAWWSTVCG